MQRGTVGGVRLRIATTASTTAAKFAVALLLLSSAACHRQTVAPATNLPPLPVALHGARLPAQLTDSAYWNVVTEFSEPGGYFQSENFVSNELGLQFVLDSIEQHVPPGGVYVGVGPEQNFTYIAALKPRVAFIVDIRRQNLLQHLWYKAVFELSPDRTSFLSRLFGRPVSDTTLNAESDISAILSAINRAPRDMQYFRKTFDEVRTHLTVTHGFTLDSSDLETLRYVDSIFYVSGTGLNYSSGGNSRMGGMMRNMPTFMQIALTTDLDGVNRGFLGSHEGYTYVRGMQQRNLIVPVVGNFAGPKALRTVGRWLGEHGATVGVFYLSNVEQYLFQSDDWVRFYRNVATMPIDSGSRFIRSATNRSRFGNPPGSFLMSQLTSPIGELLEEVNAGRVRGYQDVLIRSR